MWFTENPWPPMLIAGLTTLVFFAVWNSDQRKLYLNLAFAFLFLTGGIYGVERLIVTEGERLQLEVAEICDQFRRRDPKTLEHFSEIAPEWKSVCQTAMNAVEVGNDLRVTDFETAFTNANSRATVQFKASATISESGIGGYHPFRCILSFQKEGGLWKIIDVDRIDPLTGKKMEVMERR